MAAWTRFSEEAGSRNSNWQKKVKSSYFSHPKNTQNKASQYQKLNADTKLLDSFLCCYQQTELYISWNPFGRTARKHRLRIKKDLNFWRGGSLKFKARSMLLKQLTVFFKRRLTPRAIFGATVPCYQRIRGAWRRRRKTKNSCNHQRRIRHQSENCH